MFESRRPLPAQRCFVSTAVEQTIAATAATIADPELAWLFANCLPNTLDTTVTFAPDAHGQPDTFIITGDIDAMWLRDSTNQVWPYLPLAPHDPHLAAMFRGLIRRQAACVRLDPYANAFYRTPDKTGHWQSDHTTMKPGIHERKYELDSLCAVLRLAVGYYNATGDASPFDAEVLATLRLIVQTIRHEQAGSDESDTPTYTFQRTTRQATDTLPLRGLGNPYRRTGMSRAAFRPSDDASIFQFQIPANAMAVACLRQTAAMLARLQQAADLQQDMTRLADEIAAGIARHAIVDHPRHGRIYAYEVDGLGSHALLDDANVPSLLSLPYLGFCDLTDPLYQNTRRFVLSDDNIYFSRGTAGEGISGPHVGRGWIWPMALTMQALTTTDESEITRCLRTLVRTHAGTGFMHETFWKDDPTQFTRKWFAWANTLFGELILTLAHRHPHILKQHFA